MKDYTSYQFSFEKLEMYQKAIKFTNEIFNVTLKFRKEIQYSLGDQFRRAALSICNNLAEGSDKQSRKAKVQFYGYALDSARECIPMITIAKMQLSITDELCDQLRAECIFIRLRRRPRPWAGRNAKRCFGGCRIDKLADDPDEYGEIVAENFAISNESG